MILKNQSLMALATVFSLLLSGHSFAQNTADIAGDRSTTRLIPPSKPNPTGGEIYLEPILLLSSQALSMKSGQLPGLGSNTSGTVMGLGVGLKPGIYMAPSFILGIDARYEHQSMQQAFYANADANEYTLGPTVTWETPWYGIRLMGTYVMAGEFLPSLDPYGVDMLFKDPTGFRVGAGAEFGPVSVNLEYQDLRFATTQVNSAGSLPIAPQSISMNTETSGYLLSVSFPYNF